MILKLFMNIAFKIFTSPEINNKDNFDIERSGH